MSRQSAINAAEKSKEPEVGGKSKKKAEQPETADLQSPDEAAASEKSADKNQQGEATTEEGTSATSKDLKEVADSKEVLETEADDDVSADEEIDETEEEAGEDADLELDPEERYEAEIKELNDKYMRLAAEFENFKKRTNQEMQSRFKYASQPLAMAIISGLDSLERAIDQAGQAIEEEDIDHFKEFVAGIDMVKQQIFDAFKNNNIERSFPKGDLFDPNIHEAMGVIESDEVEADHIAEVFQAGYTLFDRVIRPAMVQVAKKQ